MNRVCGDRIAGEEEGEVGVAPQHTELIADELWKVVDRKICIVPRPEQRQQY
jgi:hypothetical protein